MRANGLHAHENKNLYALTAKEDIKDFQKDNTFFIQAKDMEKNMH